jgi:hypothetical protein
VLLVALRSQRGSWLLKTFAKVSPVATQSLRVSGQPLVSIPTDSLEVKVYVLKTSVRYLNGPVSSLRPTPASTMHNHSEISPAENPRGAPHFKELYPTCNLLVAYSADRERHFGSVGCHGVSDGGGSALFFPKRGWRVVLLIETRCTCPLESTCFTAILTRKIS